MAIGKPVVTFLHDEAARRTEDAYGLPVPIVNASSETLRDRLEELVEMGPSARGEIGRASRAYVERVHDLDRVTDALLDVYATVVEPAVERHATAVVPSQAPADLPPELSLGDTDLDTGAPATPGSPTPSAPRPRPGSRASSGASGATP